MTDAMHEHVLREKKLLEQLASCPIADISGVVDASGAVGAKGPGDDPWTVLFTFQAWRIEGQPLLSIGLTVRRVVRYEELDGFRALTAPYAVLRIRARLAVDSVYGCPQALLESVIGPDACDAELNAVAIELHRPVTYENRVLGTFTLDRRVGWFSGQAYWMGNRVRLNLRAESPQEAEAAAHTGEALLHESGIWTKRIRDHAVARLLTVKNDGWLEEGEKPLTADEFGDTMILETICVDPGGSFEFWYSDGGLFWGHAIVVRGDLAEGPRRADIGG